MRIRENTALDFNDVLIVPQRSTLSSRKDVNIEREFSFYHSPRVWKGCPVIAANMFATGSFNMADKLSEFKMITCLHKFYKLDELITYFKNKSVHNFDYTWLTIGQSETDIDKIKEFSSNFKNCEQKAPNLCVDVANAGREEFVKFCSKVRDNFPESIIMAGNLVSPEITQELIIHGGVDIVKVGLGSGATCITRKITGVGIPQLTAIDSCAFAAHGLHSGQKRNGLICSDGGCQTAGDICKAFCLADFVMCGGFFAGTDECNGNWTYSNTCEEGEKSIKKSLMFYGMSSYEAQIQHSGEVKNYRASEGKVVEVPYKGFVKDVANEICGGIRSCCTYIGAECIKDMPKCAEFIRVNNTHNRIYGD